MARRHLARPRGRSHDEQVRDVHDADEQHDEHAAPQDVQHRLDVANDVVAVLRAEAGRDPYDRELSDLVGELSTRSELFRTLWAAHNVHNHDTGLKRLQHPLVGELSLTFEAMELVADPGLTMVVYTAEPGSKSEQALNLLASWAAT